MSAQTSDTECMNATNTLSRDEEREIAFRSVFMAQGREELAEMFDTSPGSIARTVRHYRSVNTGELELSLLDEYGDLEE